MKKDTLIAIIGCIVAFLIGISFMTESGSSSSASSSSALDIELDDDDIIVDINQCDSSLVITDVNTLEKAFKGYSASEKLVDNVQAFLNHQNTYGVNAVFAAAVSITETGAGRAGNAVNGKHNWFNIRPGGSEYKTYSSDSEGIEAFFDRIKSEYFTHTPTPQISVKTIGADPDVPNTDLGAHGYCEGDWKDRHWSNATIGFMKYMYSAAGIEIVTGGTTSSGESSSTSETGDGYDKVFTANGKTYKEFDQHKGTYANSVKYSSDHISHSGCGPTSAAIIASGYGKDYNPGTLVQAAYKKYHTNHFDANIYNTEKMLNTAGLKTKIRLKANVNKNEVIKHLKSGKPMAVSTANKHFAVKTHYIAILAINDENKVYVSNPNHGKEDGWWSIDEVLKDLNMGVIFVLD